MSVAQTLGVSASSNRASIVSQLIRIEKEIEAFRRTPSEQTDTGLTAPAPQQNKDFERIQEMIRGMSEDLQSFMVAQKRSNTLLRDTEAKQTMDRVVGALSEQRTLGAASSGLSGAARTPKPRGSMWGIRSRTQAIDQNDTSAISEIELLATVRSHMRHSSAGYTRPPTQKPRRVGPQRPRGINKQRPVSGVDQPPKSHTANKGLKSSKFTRSAQK